MPSVAREPLSHRARRVASLSIVAIMLDGLVIATTVLYRHAYLAAPKTASTAAEDDPGYVAAGLVSAITSGIRDLVVLGLVVAILRWRVRDRGSSTTRRQSMGRAWTVTVAALFVVEVIAVCGSWSATYPTVVPCGFKIFACSVDAVIAGLVIARLRTPTELHPRPGLRAVVD